MGDDCSFFCLRFCRIKVKYEDTISKGDFEMKKLMESCLEDIEFVERQLVDFNESHVPFELTVPFNQFNQHIKDESGCIIAGINCVYYAWHCIYIDALWVSEEHRGMGLASELLTKIEQLGREYGCHLIHLDTFDFQAKDFYLKHRYEIHGVLEDCPKGHERYYMKKVLV